MDETTETRLIGLFAELGLVVDEGETKNIAFADLEADSLALMDLCVELEERFGLVIEPADVLKMETLQTLARFIDEKQPGGRGSSK
jgi:acyl carrier protein